MNKVLFKDIDTWKKTEGETIIENPEQKVTHGAKMNEQRVIGAWTIIDTLDYQQLKKFNEEMQDIYGKNPTKESTLLIVRWVDTYKNCKDYDELITILRDGNKEWKWKHSNLYHRLKDNVKDINEQDQTTDDGRKDDDNVQEVKVLDENEDLKWNWLWEPQNEKETSTTIPREKEKDKRKGFIKRIQSKRKKFRHIKQK